MHRAESSRADENRFTPCGLPSLFSSDLYRMEGAP